MNDGERDVGFSLMVETYALFIVKPINFYRLRCNVINLFPILLNNVRINTLANMDSIAIYEIGR